MRVSASLRWQLRHILNRFKQVPEERRSGGVERPCQYGRIIRGGTSPLTLIPSPLRGEKEDRASRVYPKLVVLPGRARAFTNVSVGKRSQPNYSSVQ